MNEKSVLMFTRWSHTGAIISNVNAQSIKKISDRKYVWTLSATEVNN